MMELYWGCLIFGILFAIVSVVFGDILGQAMDGVLDFLSIDGSDVFQPAVLVGGITTFGGAGLMLDAYTPFGAGAIALLAVAISLMVSVGVYFFYVRPMARSENSNAFSMQELSGAIGEVLVPVPPRGYGEVLVRVGAGVTNQIAASFDGESLESGARVVVVEVREDTLMVSRLET